MELFTIPWQALTLDELRECFILDVDRSFFGCSFDKNYWPDSPDPRWGAGTQSAESYREYSHDLKQFAASGQVERKAHEAESAVDSPESFELKRAGQAGKERGRSAASDDR